MPKATGYDTVISDPHVFMKQDNTYCDYRQARMAACLGDEVYSEALGFL